MVAHGPRICHGSPRLAWLMVAVPTIAAFATMIAALVMVHP